jgi:hypothetical protein
MPRNHEAVADWSPQRFISWAQKTGVKTREYIAWLLERKEHPEQAYRTCAGILRIGSTVTPWQMERACAHALAYNIYSYSYFAELLIDKKQQEPSDFSDFSPRPLIHENLRGKDYYKGGSHV